MARARGQRPSRREVPARLRVLVDVPGDVVLVAPQGALGAEQTAGEIVVAAAQLVLGVEAHPGHPGERPAGDRPLPCPTGVAAAVVAVECDHASRAGRRLLGSDGNGKILQHGAVTVVAHQPDGLVFGQPEVVDEAALLLLEALAGIECQCRGGGLIGIGRELGGGEAERIVRARPGHDVGDEGQLVARSEGVIHLGVEGIIVRVLVRPKAAPGEVRQVDIVVERPDRIASVDSGAYLTEAAIAQIRANLAGAMPSAVKIWITPPAALP